MRSIKVDSRTFSDTEKPNGEKYRAAETPDKKVDEERSLLFLVGVLVEETRVGANAVEPTQRPEIKVTTERRHVEKNRGYAKDKMPTESRLGGINDRQMVMSKLGDFHAPILDTLASDVEQYELLRIRYD